MNRDNQQVTDIELGWLAGIWDGEGTFGLSRQNRNNGVYYNTKVSMENTSIPIIDECQRILKKAGIKYFIVARKAKTKKHKNRFVLQVVRHTEIVKFCQLVNDYLISKKVQCELLEEFCNSRVENGRSPILEREHAIALELNILNKMGQSDTSTTLRETLEKQEKNRKRWLSSRDDKV